jgi:hypothetical protein
VIELHNSIPTSAIKQIHRLGLEETLSEILHSPVTFLSLAPRRKQEMELVQKVKKFRDVSSKFSLLLLHSALYPPSAVRYISSSCCLLYILLLLPALCPPPAVCSLSSSCCLLYILLLLSALYPTSAVRPISSSCCQLYMLLLQFALNIPSAV